RFRHVPFEGSCSKLRIPRCTTAVPIQLARLPLCRARNTRIDSARYEAFVRSDCSLQIVVFDAGDEANVLERSEMLLGCTTQKSHYRHRRLLRARRERPRRRAAEKRDEIAAVHVWMAPAWQEIIWRAAQRSLAVMCPACSRSPEGLLALMESANRGLITRAGSMSR